MKCFYSIYVVFVGANIFHIMPLELLSPVPHLSLSPVEAFRHCNLIMMKETLNTLLHFVRILYGESLFCV